MLIDSHAHLDIINTKIDILPIINRANNKNVSSILSINTKIDNFDTHYKKIKNYKSIWFTVGEHPCNINKNNIPSKEKILKYLSKPKVIGVGETGLDFYYSKKYMDSQYKSLKNHIDASLLTDLPLIIHLRNSEKELIDFLINENKKNQLKVVMHCFNCSKNSLIKCLDNNFFISLSGIVTFKNAKDLQDLVKFIPLNRLLLETDSPFLTPSPKRGEMNEPCNIHYIALFISNLIKIDLAKLAKYTSNNFYKLFSKAIKYDNISYEN